MEIWEFAVFLASANAVIFVVLVAIFWFWWH